MLNTLLYWFSKLDSSTVVSLISVCFAGFSAWVAARTLYYSNKSFRLAQRPYVVVETIQIKELPNNNNPIAAEIVIKNTGATPALNIRCFRNIDVLKGIPSVDSDISEENGSIMLGSNLKRALRVEGGRPLNENEIKSINEGNLKIYVSGTVSYKDIFQQSHKTTFCSFFDPNEKFSPLFLFASSKFNEIK